MLMLDWRIDLQHQDDDIAGVVEASTCLAISLMHTPLLDGVCWSCKSLLAAGSASSTGEGAPSVKVSTPFGDAIGVIWLSLSAAGTKLHGLSRMLPCLLLPFTLLCGTESIILSAGGAETIMLSAHAESIILSTPPAESNSLSTAC
jgi:hypothetical protein